MAGSCANAPKKQGNDHVPRPSDTLYTRQAAMNIYAYQPERALAIIDSAVIVGNLDDFQADLCRARIYSSTQMQEQIDSLLGGAQYVALDTAEAIGQRLLRHDSVKTHLKRQKEVLEILSYTNRMQNDTLGWIQRLQELETVCRQIGVDAEADALRTEAEIGAALCAMGQQQQGMEKLDSAIYLLEASFHRQEHRGTFKELDALIIALKRKILLTASHDKYAETLPLARLIIERLDDYEKYPERYHDGSSREPKSEQKRADYIRYYRGQAQSYITAAYTSLGEHDNMLTAFKKIEDGVRKVTAREHLARYHALQQQMHAERQQAKAHRNNLIAMGICLLSLAALALTIVIYIKNKAISRKNQLLVKQIAETLDYKEKYLVDTQSQDTRPEDIVNIESLSDKELFQYIHDIIIRERLFQDPHLDRQSLMDRFLLSKERVGAVFANGSKYSKLNSYLQQVRLEYAAKLLIEQPDKSIVQVAAECGFSSNSYFSSCFRQRFSMSPTDFRRDAVSLLKM